MSRNLGLTSLGDGEASDDIVLIDLLDPDYPAQFSNFRTGYLSPAIKTSLTAKAQVRRVGRTVGVVDVDVVNDEGKLVAVGRGTFSSNAS